MIGKGVPGSSDGVAREAYCCLRADSVTYSLPTTNRALPNLPREFLGNRERVRWISREFVLLTQTDFYLAVRSSTYLVPASLAVATRGLELAGVITDSSPRIVNYHSIGDAEGYGNISLDTFRSHIRWLSERFDVVPLKALRQGEGDRKRVSITFDDGLESYRKHALPVLREFRIPSTVFVIGAAVGNTGGMDAHHLGSERLGTGEPLMDRAALRSLVDDPLVTIGSHSLTHPRLPVIDGDRMDGEIGGGKQALESTLDITIDSFAYPYNYWNDRVHRKVKQHFEYAVHGWGRHTLITDLTDRHLLPRIDGGVGLRQLQYRVRDFSTLLATSRRAGMPSFDPTPDTGETEAMAEFDELPATSAHPIQR